LDKIVKVSTETGKRLGEAALELEIVSAEKLYAMMARQVEEVFFAAVHVSDGAFYFFDRFDEKSILHRHSLNASGLLMEAARRMDEMSFFREKVPGGHYIPVQIPGKKLPTTEEDLSPVWNRIDGQRSIEDIGRALGQPEFEVTRAVFQLISGGCCVVIAPR